MSLAYVGLLIGVVSVSVYNKYQKKKYREEQERIKVEEFKIGKPTKKIKDAEFDIKVEKIKKNDK